MRTRWKRCTSCGLEKGPDDFYGNSNGGKRAWCKLCYTVRVRTNQKRNPERERRRHKGKNLRRDFGLSYAEYEELVRASPPTCAICREPESISTRSGLSLDHCHTTGELRGFLCGNCNSALGLLADRIELLERAIHYLRHPPLRTCRFNAHHRVKEVEPEAKEA